MVTFLEGDFRHSSGYENECPIHNYYSDDIAAWNTRTNDAVVAERDAALATVKCVLFEARVAQAKAGGK